VVVCGGHQERLTSNVGPEKGCNWVQVVNAVNMEWPRLHWYQEVSTRAIWVFIMLIQREEGNTVYRNIGPKMERELLNHLGDVRILSQGEVSVATQHQILCLFKLVGCSFTRGLFSFIVHRCPCDGASYNCIEICRGCAWIRGESQIIWLQLHVNP
jgi:hypothetical protein